MRKAQLGMFDTTYVEWADRGKSTDYVVWWAFRRGDEVDVQALIDQLKRRIRASNVLNRRLQHVPFHLDYPYWVFGARDIDGAIAVEPGGPITWRDCLDRMTELVVAPLDVTVVPWAVHIFPDVEGVVETDAPSLVVAMTLSHAVFAGQATGPLGEYLWGPEGLDFTLNGLPEATDRYSTVGALARSSRTIGQTASNIWHLIKEKPVPAPVIETPDWVGRDFWSNGERRELENAIIDVPRGSAFTVTQLFAAAIPRALAQFHGDDAYGTTTVNLPVGVPYESLMGANSLMFVVLPVHLDRSTSEQLDWVRDEMRSQLTAHNGEKGLAAASSAQRVPRYAQRIAMNQNGVAMQGGDTVLSSMRFTPQSQWSAAGLPLASAGFVPANAIGRLVHTLWTAGDRMTVTVGAWPREAGAVARYLDILVKEVDSLLVSTPKANR